MPENRFAESTDIAEVLVSLVVCAPLCDEAAMSGLLTDARSRIDEMFVDSHGALLGMLEEATRTLNQVQVVRQAVENAARELGAESAPVADALAAVVVLLDAALRPEGFAAAVRAALEVEVREGDVSRETSNVSRETSNEGAV